MHKFNQFKYIHEHSADLALLINQLGYHEVFNWLMIASGIKNIDFSWNRFDKTGGSEWCRPAYEYDIAKSKVTQIYIKELTVFNYVWGGFENLLSSLFSKNQVKKNGKINLYIEQFNEYSKSHIFGYNLFKDDFFLNFNNSLADNLISYNKKIDEEELILIYNIRNKFAHGDIEFPEDCEYNSNLKSPADLIKLIKASTRILLCQIQGSVLHLNKNQLIFIYLDNIFSNIQIGDYEGDSLPVEFIIPRLHLKNIDRKDIDSLVL